MTRFLYWGKFTPEFWRAICNDPADASSAFSQEAAQNDCSLDAFFFALEEFDFYVVLVGKNSFDLAMCRHRLMASGQFSALHAEEISTFGEMFGER